jgi:hypothetical protein
VEAALASLSSEIRTGRLIIGEETYPSRIVAEVSSGRGELRIEAAPSADGPQTSVILFAYADGNDLGPGAGVQLWANGDAIAELNAWSDDQTHWCSSVTTTEGPTAESGLV